MKISNVLWRAMLVAATAGAAWTPLQAQSVQHYLILARANKTDAALLQAVAAAGGTVTRALPAIGVVLADSSNANFAAAMAANSAIQNVALDTEVQWISGEQAVDADPVLQALTVDSSEPFGHYQWNLAQIGADKAAKAGEQGQGAVVAVLDSGIAYDHPDLQANIDLAHSISLVQGEDLYPPPGFNHGTHVAGIIAAAINGIGVQGVAPKATIVAVKVLSAKGSGTFGTAIAGMEYATSLGVDVINMSLGATFDRKNAGGGNSGILISALNRAVDHATAAGVLVVSAAGNEAVDLNSRLWSSPAQSGNGMAVAATGPVGLTNFDRAASYTNYGQSVISVAAPGGDSTLYPAANYYLDMVLSPGGAGGKYYFASGTSMAAPHVSGLAALLVGKYGHVGAAQLRRMIENSAVDILKPGADPYSGHGRIDALRALGLQ